MRQEAARKAGVGVELHQDFLGVADGQTRIQPLVQGNVEFGHVAHSREGGDRRDGLLLGRQRLFGAHRFVLLGSGRGWTGGQAQRGPHGHRQGNWCGLGAKPALNERCIAHR